MRPSISVIVPTHDRPETLLRVVRAICAQRYAAAELIVVNDGQTEVPPSVVELAEAAGLPYRYARQDAASVSASRNRGIAEASGDVLLFLDDDIVPGPEYLDRLAGLYEADREGEVAGIGGVYEVPRPGLSGRIFAALAGALARNRWAFRRCAARYVALPAGLRGRLRPAGMLSGGTLSVRRDVAAEFRFDEYFDGYGLGEDLEFSCRVSRGRAMFAAPELTALHEAGAGGRPDMRRRGRVYMDRMFRIACRNAGADVGVWTVLAYHLLGTIVLSLLWAGLGSRGSGLLAAGMLGALADKASDSIRKMLCGS